MTDETEQPEQPQFPTPAHSDDSLMDRFDRTGTRKFTARDALIAALIFAVIGVIFAGHSIKRQGDQERNGIGRAAMLAVGRPASWVADQTGGQQAAHDATHWLSPDTNLNEFAGFSTKLSSTGGVPSVTPDAFTPGSLGLPAPAKMPLHTVLVTGDSMSEPLDQYVAQDLDPHGVKVIQDPHIGTGISSTVLVNWAKLSAYQVKHDQPDAVVVFIGANDGYSMTGPDGKMVNCCSAEWAAIYANRVRQMMNTYRQDGVARVYWLTLPTPRDHARKEIADVVNAAIKVGAQPWADQVHVLDTVPIFTPGGTYRDSMTVGGQPTIVRQSDGIHLNNAGSQLEAKYVIAAIDQDFTP